MTTSAYTVSISEITPRARTLPIGLTEGNNSAIARHGVSAPSGVQAGLHPPRYAALLNPPSPRFGHSSCRPAGHIARRLGVEFADQDVGEFAILPRDQAQIAAVR